MSNLCGGLAQYLISIIIHVDFKEIMNLEGLARAQEEFFDLATRMFNEELSLEETDRYFFLSQIIRGKEESEAAEFVANYRERLAKCADM